MGPGAERGPVRGRVVLARPCGDAVNSPVMKVYTYNYDTAEVVERECETFGYPHSCTNGERMFENSHFRTPREAWASLVSNLESGVLMDANDRALARRTFEEATVRLADTAEKLAKVKAAGPPAEPDAEVSRG